MDRLASPPSGRVDADGGTELAQFLFRVTMAGVVVFVAAAFLLGW